METRHGSQDPASALGERQAKVMFEDKGLVANLTDCLSFSPAFQLTGFETMNDKVLREMNERAKHQLGKVPPVQPRQAALPRTRPLQTENSHSELSARGPAPKENGKPRRLQKSIASTKPIPESTSMFFNDHRNRNTSFGSTASSAHPLPAPPSPPKRTNAGLESPSKRLRARDGVPSNVPTSPTTSMSQLSINEKERLTQVSAARQQLRRGNTSPRRRHFQKNGEASNKAQMSLNSRPLPSLKLEQPTEGNRVREPVGKQVNSQARPQRKLGERPNLSLSLPPRGTRSLSQSLEAKSAIPRSTSSRSVSATASSGERMPLPTEFNNLPSYARPTKAALRRSQSTVPHQQQGLSQHLHPSSSTRSVSRLLN